MLWIEPRGPSTVNPPIAASSPPSRPGLQHSPGACPRTWFWLSTSPSAASMDEPIISNTGSKVGTAAAVFSTTVDERPVGGDRDAARLDDLGFGRLIRMRRIRRGWRQQDLAAACGLSRGTISRIERGHLHELSIGSLRRVTQVLDISVELLPRSRLGDGNRLANARHAALAEFVVAWLA